MTTWVAVLAHRDRPALADLLDNIRATQPGAQVVVFNGGSDPRLADGLGVEVCPASRPLRHGHLAAFHGSVLGWLAERDPQWVVTLDSDVLLVRPLPLHGADYLGPHLGEVRPGTPWRPGRRVLRGWPGWQDLLPVEHPLRCFNPVQCFGAGYVRGLAAWPARAALLDRVERAREVALEEVVWPTLARALGLQVAELPGGRALRLRPPTEAELRADLADPAVSVVHKVRTCPGAVERAAVAAHLHTSGAGWPDARAWAAGAGGARSRAGVRRDVLDRAARRLRRTLGH